MKKSMKAVKLIAQGYTIEETADVLCVSRSSVEKYLRGERLRLKCRTLSNLIHVVTRDGLICLLIVAVAASSTNTYRRVSRPYRREQQLGAQII